MGYLSRSIEQRASSSTLGHPRDPVLVDWMGGGVNTAAGVPVTPDTAMRETAVYTCIRVLSESVAQLPLHIYRKRKDGGKDKADGHPLYDLLHTTPNEWQTSFEFREMLMGFVNLRGNAVCRVVHSNGNAVSALVPLHPDRLEIYRTTTGKRAYRYQLETGGQETLLQDEVMHLSGLSLDGLSGLSPIKYHKETVGASLAIKEFGARLFSNGTHIGSVFEHPEQLGDNALKHLKESIKDRFSGAINAGKPIILEEGMKVAKLGMTAEESQYLDSRKFTRSEIAGLYRVPPHKIGDLDKATFSNIEQQSIEFVTDTLMPWLVRFEQVISRDLISIEDRKRGYFAEFNVMGLLRGDAAARATYYKSRFEVGSITPNQIRAHENENPQKNGDTAYVPLNMIPIDQAGRSDTKSTREHRGTQDEE